MGLFAILLLQVTSDYSTPHTHQTTNNRTEQTTNAKSLSSLLLLLEDRHKEQHAKNIPPNSRDLFLPHSNFHICADCWANYYFVVTIVASSAQMIHTLRINKQGPILLPVWNSEINFHSGNFVRIYCRWKMLSMEQQLKMERTF